MKMRFVRLLGAALWIAVPAVAARAADICDAADARAEIVKTTQLPAYTSCELYGLSREFTTSAGKQVGALLDLATIADEGGEINLPGITRAEDQIAELNSKLAATDWTMQGDAKKAIDLIAAVAKTLREAAAPLEAMNINNFDQDKRLSFCWSNLERDRQRKLVDRLKACPLPVP